MATKEKEKKKKKKRMVVGVCGAARCREMRENWKLLVGKQRRSCRTCPDMTQLAPLPAQLAGAYSSSEAMTMSRIDVSAARSPDSSVNTMSMSLYFGNASVLRTVGAGA